MSNISRRFLLLLIFVTTALLSYMIMMSEGKSADPKINIAATCIYIEFKTPKGLKIIDYGAYSKYLGDASYAQKNELDECIIDAYIDNDKFNLSISYPIALGPKKGTRAKVVLCFNNGKSYFYNKKHTRRTGMTVYLKKSNLLSINDKITKKHC